MSIKIWRKKPFRKDNWFTNDRSKQLDAILICWKTKELHLTILRLPQNFIYHLSRENNEVYTFTFIVVFKFVTITRTYAPLYPFTSFSHTLILS